ncbi:MAG TPA: hydroxymethylglutaryl-CoA synthase [Candidatus Norongarragalinales archaeon]|nr:hydroxymethylglutaryl-CoA synthase [Candidatus Norongarragalinales archaeon]
MTVGIAGYGTYVPKMRIKVEEIASVWGKDARRVSEGLGIREKAVASIDEDTATIAVEAAKRAVKSAKIDAKDINAIFVGSESKPYAVKPTATMVGAALNTSPHFTAADFEFACKAGTTAMQACMGMAESKMIKYGLAIGADTAQGRPNDALEFSAGSGGAAFIIGRENLIAEIEGTYSYTTDTPDFWRRQHAEYPRHGGRFTAEPAYFKHVLAGAKGMMERMGTSAQDYDYFVPHQPNGKFPVRVAKMLGFEMGKVTPGLITPFIGNTYSGSSIVGLCAVLDVAKAGDRILLVSYGSGAGSDAFSIKVTKQIEEKGRRQDVPVMEQIKEKKYVSYAIYAKHRRKLKSE